MSSDRESLLLALRGAANQQNPNAIRESESRLSEWRTRPGFHAALVDVVLAVQQIETEVR